MKKLILFISVILLLIFTASKCYNNSNNDYVESNNVVDTLIFDKNHLIDYNNYFGWFVYCYINHLDINTTDEDEVTRFLDVFCETDDYEYAIYEEYYIDGVDTIPMNVICDSIKKYMK